VAVIVAAALVVLVVLALQLRPRTADTRPVVLPDAFAGWTSAPQAQQFAQAGDWRGQSAHAYGGNAYDGHAYGTRLPVNLLNLVVARTDATGFGDVGLGVAPFTAHGDVRCTRTFHLPDGTTASRPSSGMLMCFRADEHLTVSVVGLGQEQDESRIAAGIDDVWGLQG